ncbi:MAG TPA: alkaline phosphatase family protein [Geminicoccaceae bacterium]
MRKQLTLLVAASIGALGAASFEATAADKPKLILAITVDGLRGDIPFRLADRFGPGGFRRLIEQGIVYDNAQYQHSTTFTAVGHATLFTGGNSAQHGLAGNDWHDPARGQQVYCVEDDRHPIIGKEPKAHEGTSPRNLTASTYGDELILASGGRSRVFSVSIKDRGAILPGGRLGKAFWYSSSSGEFVTSTYYYDDYPAWVADWNAAKHADGYMDATWEIIGDRADYVFAHADDRPSERPYKHLGRAFPHKLGAEKASDFYGALRYTPMGDELTLEFAKELVKQEKVGQGEATDMLAISFSTTDYIAHAFGPNSLESEEGVLRLDTTLADLFAFVDQTVGLDRTLIVLSSDHGFDEVPEHQKELGFDAGRHYPEKFVEQTNAGLQERYKSEDNFVVAFWNPSLYLNHQTLQQLAIDRVDAERALAEEILKVPGIALAMTRSDLMAGTITEHPILRKVQRAFHPKLSGDVLIVQDQFWYLYPNAEEFAAMHGSPYAYDTYVPLMLAGPGIPKQVVSRPVAPEDIAITVATYMGTKPPSGSVGEVLYEALPAGPRSVQASSQ